METKEFDNTRFGQGMKVKYNLDSQIYFIKAVDFVERLIGIIENEELLYQDNEEDIVINWIRCENAEIII